jgi:hypothetical protein
MQIWKYLHFFDKNGKNYNFDYDSDQDMWTGDIYLPEVSTGLFEVAQIFVLQEMINRDSPYFLSGTNTFEFGFPHDLEQSTSATGTGGWNLEWKDTTPTEFKLFQFDTNFNTGTQSSLEIENDGPPIEFYDEINVPLDYDVNQTFNPDGYLITNRIRSEALQINISFSADEENTYRRTLKIIDQNTNSTVAEFTIYAETVEEDERLKVMTQNFGYNIIAKDSIIFRNTDINESLPDFREVNTKRKEIMLEGHNIYTYIGSYKGLINAIKFFGYDNLQIKEFWKNVNSNSPKFGTYIQSAPIGIFNPTVELNDQKITLPNKNFRKTSMFSLIYKINDIVPDEFDIEDLPIVEETSDFTIEEVLIKLFGLKKKLESEFLPLNAHIKDIVGEADFFGLQEVTNTISKNNTNTLKIGIDAAFDVEPNECVYLEDLRSFALDCLKSEAIVGEAFVDFCNAFISPLLNNTGSNLILGPYNSGDVLPKPPIGPDENSPLGPIIDGNNVTIDSIADVFLSYFSRYSPNINTTEFKEGRSSNQLPDKPGIPIGAPVVLNNLSFGNLTWENVNSTWNQLDNGASYYFVDFRPLTPSLGDIYILRDPATETEVTYTVQAGDTAEDVRDSLYTQIQTLKNNFIDPWLFYEISKTEENCNTSGVCEFYNIRLYGNTVNRLEVSVIENDPSSTSAFQKIVLPGAELYTWDSILRGNFTEIEWTVYKDATDISPDYYFNVRGPISTYERLPLVLPFVGNYSVEMKLFDTYNNISSKVELDRICVEGKEVEYSGWYQARKYKYTWSSEGEYIWNDYGSYWNLPIEPSVKLNEETPKLYESLDRVNAILNNFGLGSRPDFQLLNFQNDGKVSFTGPYQWNNLNVGDWNDTYHLWWDMTSTSGDTPAFFQFSELPIGSYLKITDVKGNTGEFYFDPSYTTLSQAAADMNVSNDPIIKKYIYNVVYDAGLNQKFIQGVSRYFGVYGDWSFLDVVDSNGDRVCASTGSSSFTGSTGSTGSTGCESIIYKRGKHITSNPTWNTARFIDDGKTLPRFTWLMFVFDNCRILGKDKARWTIKNTTDPNAADIYFESRYLTYLFKYTGKYNITLELEDSNGNKYKKERNILIIN